MFMEESMTSNIKKEVPIISFFGTKGGVGKTTITNRFADLVVISDKNPNVLIIDFDVEARGTTILRTRGERFTCPTVHEYIANRKSKIEEIYDASETVDVRGKPEGSERGKLYLIPSATRDAKGTFQAISEIGKKPEDLKNLVQNLINSAVERYGISCVLIDCGPIIDPTTATAAHIASQAFIIGQNEPISWEALKEYRAKIRENFYSDFDSMKMNTILNKVRASVPGSGDFFAIIPFTIDIVDVSEGLRDVDEVRLTLLDYYIYDVVKRTLEKEYPELVPDPKYLLSSDWQNLLVKAPSLQNSFGIKLHKIAGKILLPFASLIFAVSLVAKYIPPFKPLLKKFPLECILYSSLGVIIISIILWQVYREPAIYLEGVRKGGADFLFQELRKRSGRRILERIKNWIR